MAYPTSVNGQITDSVTQANVNVLAVAPAQAMAMIYQVMSQAVGLSMQNAVARQRNMSTIDTAVTTQSVNQLYGIPTAANARGTVDVFSNNELAQTLVALLTAVLAAKQKS